MSVVGQVVGCAFRARVAVAAAWLLGVAGAGCTVNGRPLTGSDPRRYFENDARTGRSVMIDAWGINLSTVHGDAGLTLGRTRRTYYFAGPGSAVPGAAPTEHLSGGDAPLRLAATRPFDWPAAQPLAVRGRTDGVGVAADAARAGLTLGIQTFSAVRVPNGANLLLLIKSDRAAPGQDVFHVKETRP